MERTQARELLKKYNKEPFHLYHAKVVSGVMRFFGKKLEPQNEEIWAIIGLLHDIDYEMYPNEHPMKTEELLKPEGMSDEMIKSIMTHGWGVTNEPYKPESLMEKVLYAVDELTGLIGAVALMRPSKSVQDLELSSVKKKFKDKKFAAGCSREIIIKGAEMLSWELDYLIEQTILAMRTCEEEVNQCVN